MVAMVDQGIVMFSFKVARVITLYYIFNGCKGRLQYSDVQFAGCKGWLPNIIEGDEIDPCWLEYFTC